MALSPAVRHGPKGSPFTDRHHAIVAPANRAAAIGLTGGAVAAAGMSSRFGLRGIGEAALRGCCGSARPSIPDGSARLAIKSRGLITVYGTGVTHCPTSTATILAPHAVAICIGTVRMHGLSSTNPRNASHCRKKLQLGLRVFQTRLFKLIVLLVVALLLTARVFPLMALRPPLYQPLLSRRRPDGPPFLVK